MIAKATALESIMRMMAATRQLWACMDAPARLKFRTQIQTDPLPQVAEGNILPRRILRRAPSARSPRARFPLPEGEGGSRGATAKREPGEGLRSIVRL